MRPAPGASPAASLRRGVLLLALAAAPGATAAQEPAPPPKPAAASLRQSASLTIEADKAQLIQLPGAAKTVFVANPEIADVQVPTPASFLVYGKKPGTTTVFAITESGETIGYTVRVTRPVADVAAAVRGAAPDSRLRVTAAPGGITISGSVGSPREAQQVKAAARLFLGDKDVINFDIGVTAATQVTLKVRVAEVSRNIDKQLGVNWSQLFSSGSLAVGLLTGRTAVSTFGNFISAGSPTTYGSVGVGYRSRDFNASAVIDALDQDGLATILAEPTLTAISGETANFLAGGEYPIPVPQGNQTVTIDYKRYGVSVDFTPTVLDGNRINIKVRPEVSELTSTGQLVLNNVAVPALTVRRVETTVELGSGQSFAIAGLFQNNAQSQIQQLPLLANLPILGALFRSTRYQRNETELVIIVTPYIVRPVSQPNALQVPTDGLRFSSDIERILKGRLTAAPASVRAAMGGASPRLQGSAGFMME